LAVSIVVSMMVTVSGMSAVIADIPAIT